MNKIDISELEGPSIDAYAVLAENEELNPFKGRFFAFKDDKIVYVGAPEQSVESVIKALEGMDYQSLLIIQYKNETESYVVEK